jgi:hypothetical protein
MKPSLREAQRQKQHVIANEVKQTRDLKKLWINSVEFRFASVASPLRAKPSLLQ